MIKNILPLLLTSLFFASCRPATIRNAAPLLNRICSSPAGLKVIEVHTEPDLQKAVHSLRSNTELRIDSGVYALTRPLVLPRGLSNIVIRGATGNRDDVKLKGRGMYNKSIPSGIWMSHVNRALLADLTVEGVYYHAVTLNEASDNVTICNVHLTDAGDQILKSNPGKKKGNENGIVEHSLIDFTTIATDTYTRGIDVIKGNNWIIRDNVFKNIRAPKGQRIVGPTILMWQSTRNSIVERNRFYNCQTGIGFGLVERQPDDHTGGIIRNNFFYRKSTESGYVGISVADSPGTKVLNNTIILNGTYERAIEYRFPDTKEIEIINNLTDAPISSRNGATAILVSNLTSAKPEWFLETPEGDVHLTNAAVDAIDQGKSDVDLQNDIDEELRPQGAAVDIGADEYSIR